MEIAAANVTRKRRTDLHHSRLFLIHLVLVCPCESVLRIQYVSGFPVGNKNPPSLTQRLQPRTPMPARTRAQMHTFCRGRFVVIEGPDSEEASPI